VPTVVDPVKFGRPTLAQRAILAEKEQAWETKVARKTRQRASNSR